MSFFSSLFRKKEVSITNYADFWQWFQQHEQQFHKVVKKHQHIERDFLNHLSDALVGVQEGIYFVTGMYDEQTAELIFTADGNVNHFVFVEELVGHAPVLNGWRFTAHKPGVAVDDIVIEMDGVRYDSSSLFFFATLNSEYPDEIDLTFLHSGLTSEQLKDRGNGIFIFIDNYIGELDFVQQVDSYRLTGCDEAVEELIPIAKLKEYLVWREKEFIEKYDGVRYQAEDDSYHLMEAELENGNRLLAVINADLLEWDSKVSHPWVAVLTIEFKGENGMPTSEDFEMLQVIEDRLLATLKDSEGYLYVGRKTANNERDIYFACRDFRKPSSEFRAIRRAYLDHFTMSYEVYKDKYWQSFEGFRKN